MIFDKLGRRQKRSEAAHKCTVTLDVNGGDHHTFTLVLEKLQVGEASLDFWNVDGRQLRSRGAGANGRAAIDLWWDCQFLCGGPSVEDAVHYLMARAHERFAHRYAIHDVYNGAHLGRCADREYAIPVEESARLWNELNRWGPSFVQAELERLLLRHEGMKYGEEEAADVGGLPDEGDLSAYTLASQNWLATGVAAVRNGDRAAVEAWLDRVEKLCRDYQRRAGDKQMKGVGGRARRFANNFQYECMTAFQICLANAYMLLIPRLERFVKLDPLSARFLQLMHQVQRPDDPTGLHRRGAFCGYSLATHPIGRWIMGRECHLVAVLAWLDHPDYDRHLQCGTAWGCTEYRKLLHAVLCSAWEYVAAKKQDESTGRPERQFRQAAVEGAKRGVPLAQHHAATPALLVLDEEQTKVLWGALGQSSEVKNRSCPHCALFGSLNLLGWSRISASGAGATTSIDVICACSACSHQLRLRLGRLDVEAILRAQSAFDRTMAAG